MAAGAKHDLIVWGFIIATPIYFIVHRDWADALIYMPIVLAFPTLYLALAMPIRCRFATVRGTPCRNRAYGVIFGCRAYHFWDKARIRIGMGQVDVPQPINAHRRRSSGATLENTTRVPTDRINEGIVGRISFYFMIFSALCTVGPVIVVVARWAAVSLL